MIIWKALEISDTLIRRKFVEIFGDRERILTNRQESIDLVEPILVSLQTKFCDWICREKTQIVIKELYKVLDRCYIFYYKEKKDRVKREKENIRCNAVDELLEMNRNIARNVIDSTNIWIENTILLQSPKKEEVIFWQNSYLNDELFVDLYIYGLLSQVKSLLCLSAKFEPKELFYGLRITPNEDIPAEIKRDSPIIYNNSYIGGNQNVFSQDNELLKANNTVFGVGFKKAYGGEFLLFLGVMDYFQKKIQAIVEIGGIIIPKCQFTEMLQKATNFVVKEEFITDNFMLTREGVKKQLKKNDSIIWTMGTNKIRHELNPFLYLESDQVMISHCALRQSIELWVSIMKNGGMCYSNIKDDLTAAMGKKNKELSSNLVNQLRKILQNHYEPTFDEIDVKYKRIYGRRKIDYGDFDLIFYSEEINELFLIEAKFFSDSLTSSGLVTDYEKLFRKDGYYDRCRRRYDLVMKEPEILKTFVGIEGSVNTHFLFVSSKHLEIELQDKERIVTFLCIQNLENYLEGRFLDIADDSIVVRPTMMI
jgi:hypothetical protein